MVAHGHRATATRVKKRRGGGGSLVRFGWAEGLWGSLGAFWEVWR